MVSLSNIILTLFEFASHNNCCVIIIGGSPAPSLDVDSDGAEGVKPFEEVTPTPTGGCTVVFSHT